MAVAGKAIFEKCFGNRILKMGHRWVPDFGWVEGIQDEEQFSEWSGEINQMNLVSDFLNFESSRTFRRLLPKAEEIPGGMVTLEVSLHVINSWIEVEPMA